ncbi:MAG TPA: sensor histidine kinase [Actinomycetota bacterium]|nr:sensor histidine kinase [Actinomycetota bacterium]
MSNRLLTHDALIYDSEPAFVETVVPFIEEGLAAGEGILVATSPGNTALLREAMSDDGGRIVFADGSDVYQRPETAVAAYDSALRSLAAQGYRAVRAIGEVQHGTGRLERWLPYEPVADRVFSDRPLWVVCPYDARTLPGWLIEHAKRTHSFIFGPQRERSRTFVEPEQLMASLRPAPSDLVPNGPPLVQHAARGNLRELRSAIIANTKGAEPQVAERIVTVVNELATNVIKHGGGTAYVSLWKVPAGYVADVVDPGGRLDDAFAGYRPPPNPATGGVGLWLARQMSDEFTLLGGRGLTIRVGFESRPA